MGKNPLSMFAKGLVRSHTVAERKRPTTRLTLEKLEDRTVPSAAGQAGGQVGGEERLAGAGVAVEEGQLAAGQVRPPEPVDGSNRDAVQAETGGVVEGHGRSSACGGDRATKCIMPDGDRSRGLWMSVGDYETKKGTRLIVRRIVWSVFKDN
jgi:hypothetical protein